MCAWGAPRGIDDILGRIRGNDAALTSLCLFRGRRFNEDDAYALCAALEANTTLQELSITSHPVGAASAAAFARMLAVNRTLRSLDLGNRTFGDEGVAALAPGVAASTSLRSLHLECKSISAAGCAVLAAALASSSGSGAGIEELLLGNNSIGEEGVAALLEDTACSSLRVLDLSSCGLQGAAAVQPLAAALQQGRLAHLQHLRLDGNDLGADGAAALAVALSSGSGATLQQLHLQRCSLGAAGVAALAAALPAAAAGEAAAAAALEVLDLSGNAVGSEGAAALADALASGSAPHLRRLQLCGAGLEDASIAALAGALAARPGPEAAAGGSGGLALDLSSNAAGVAAAAALAAAPQLTSLCLHDCKLGGTSAAATLAEQLAAPGAFHQLEELDVSANRFSTAELLPLLAALTAADDAPGGGGAAGEAGAGVPCPRLRLLVIAANTGAADEEVSTAVERLQEGRPGLDVVRRAADTGEGGLMR